MEGENQARRIKTRKEKATYPLEESVIEIVGLSFGIANKKEKESQSLSLFYVYAGSVNYQANNGRPAISALTSART